MPVLGSVRHLTSAGTGGGQRLAAATFLWRQVMGTPRHEYRVGLVGFGGRGRGLARFWQGISNAHIVAAADLIPARRDQARGALGDVALYETHQDMLTKEDFDIVTIATTGHVHAAITR